jgi:hypothetical protein
MATKREKRLAGEARRDEVESKARAQREDRARKARLRAKRRAEREAAQARSAQAAKAARRIAGGATPPVVDTSDPEGHPSPTAAP